jgi:CBS domain-containing protein
MNVETIMSRNTQFCSPTQSLGDAARLMWDRDCGCLPVVGSDREVIGMITDRDICMAACFRGRPLHEIDVGSTMSHELTTCRPSDTIEAAEVVMAAAQVRRLPVVDDGGRLVGVISLSDIACEAERQERGEGRTDVPLSAVALTLSAVGKRREGDGYATRS